MNIETILGELRGIKGYKGSGIMDFTGELLSSDTTDDNMDFELASATFNDIFRGAHEAAGKVGLQATTEMILNTPNGIIIMLCSGIRSEPHLHLITVLEKDGNQALAKMTMNKLIPKFIKELS
jgi:predicted regulator of Ras-like GTPase activity (Roadblock/LC7/MglB family)